MVLETHEVLITEKGNSQLNNSLNDEPANPPEPGFIDDDYGLNKIREESEQIRQQQILIEQEVKFVGAFQRNFILIILFLS